MGATASAALFGCQSESAIHGVAKSHLLRMAGELLCIPISAAVLRADTRRLLDMIRPAGVLLRPENIVQLAQTRELSDAIKLASGSPVFLCTDQEGGSVSRLAYDITLPSEMALGAVNETSMAFAYGEALGSQLRSAGIDTDLAPVLDVAPFNSVLGTRSIGDEPAKIMAMASPIIRGLNKAGVRAIAKHFPGYGRCLLNPEYMKVVDDSPVQLIRRGAYRIFRHAAVAGVQGAMTAHTVFSSIDSRPASVSPPLVHRLRTIMGAHTMIISDSLSMGAIRNVMSLEDAVISVIKSGSDCVMLGSVDDVPAAVEALAGALQDGSVTSEQYVGARTRTRLFRSTKLFPVGQMPGNAALNLLAQKISNRAVTANRLGDIRRGPYMVVAFGGRRWERIARGLASSIGGDAPVQILPVIPNRGDFQSFVSSLVSDRVILFILDDPRNIPDQAQFITMTARYGEMVLLALEDPRQIGGMSHFPWLASYGSTAAQVDALVAVLTCAKQPTMGEMPISLA